MLRRCLRLSLICLAALTLVSAVVAGWQGAASTMAGAILVIAFSAITLLIGHVSGPEDPMRAIALFVAAYLVKVIALGAALLLVGRPDWLVPGWFLASALVTVLAWQVAELAAFAASRRTLYADEEGTP